MSPDRQPTRTTSDTLLAVGVTALCAATIGYALGYEHAEFTKPDVEIYVPEVSLTEPQHWE